MEILFAVLLALFLAALDQTIVGTALPTHRGRSGWHQRALHLGHHHLPADERPSAASSTASCPTCIGRRPMLLIGITIFLIGSALSGLSWNMESLDPVPRPPGPRCGRHLPRLARGHRRPVHTARARPLPGPVRCGVRGGVRGRTAAGRMADRHGRLALDLLRQHAHRRRRAVHHLSLPAVDQARRGRATWTTWAPWSSRWRSSSCCWA